MSAAPYVIEPLALPATAGSPDAGEFREFGELSDALVLETWGNADRLLPLEARLQYWRDNPHAQVRLFFVRVDGRMAGRSWMRFGVRENVRTALLHVIVLRKFRGHGIGRALLAHAEQVAASRGCTTLQKAGERYELLHWRDRCPEDLAEQLAVLMSRMSTDTPVGALSYDAESWDVARVRHVEKTWKQAGLDSLVACARHRGTGELAAYSVLQVAEGKPWLANQDDTLVASHHRGHRLGMLVKLLNIRRLLAGYPDVERIVTFNAAENNHMLSINVALGFKPAGYDGEWQETL